MKPSSLALVPQPETVGDVMATVEEAVAEIASGRMLVVVDSEDRENEGDIVMAADFVEAEHVNFMATHARGWICLALSPERCDELGLEPMAHGPGSGGRTAFTVTVDARRGVTTGISAADRAHTMRVASDPARGPRDLVKGGHVVPLRARPQGILERRGHAEAAVDLARLAGRAPAGVVCNVMNGDGTMARFDDLVTFCRRHDLRMLCVSDLVAHRRRTKPLVERVVSTRLPTARGTFQAVGFRATMGADEYVALVKGDVAGRCDVPVRVHSACVTGEVFHSLRCDCRRRLHSALDAIEREGQGVLVYLQQDGLQDDIHRVKGRSVDPRGRVVAAEILSDLGVRSVRWLTDDDRATLAAG